MSPTPSDARCATCGESFADGLHSVQPFPGYHAFVPPTRVDEAPPPTKWPRGTCQKNDKPHAKSDACIDFVEVPTPEQPAVTGEPTCKNCGDLLNEHGLNVDGSGRPCKRTPFDLVMYRPAQDNIGISQTTSRASRPTVELLGAIGDEYWDARSDDDLMNDVHEALGCGQMPHDMSLAVLYSRLSAARQRITELSTRDPVSRTLGATELPRDDSTDVYQLAQLRSQLSSTRTALQRVREAGQAYFAAKDAWAAAPVAYDSSAMNGDHPLYTACAAMEEDLRALTSTETDQ